MGCLFFAMYSIVYVYVMRINKFYYSYYYEQRKKRYPHRKVTSVGCYPFFDSLNEHTSPSTLFSRLFTLFPTNTQSIIHSILTYTPFSLVHSRLLAQRLILALNTIRAQLHGLQSFAAGIKSIQAFHDLPQRVFSLLHLCGHLPVPTPLLILRLRLVLLPLPPTFSCFSSVPCVPILSSSLRFSSCTTVIAVKITASTFSKCLSLWIRSRTTVSPDLSCSSDVSSAARSFSRSSTLRVASSTRFESIGLSA